MAVSATVLAGLFVAWLLFAWLVFDPLVRWALPRQVAQHGGYQLAIGQARLHPLRLSATLQDVALREPGGRPLLTLGALTLDLDATGLLRRAWTFDELTVDAPVVSVELRPDGRLNWLDFAQAWSDPAAPPAPPEAAPPRLLVRRLAITGGAVDFEDRQVGGGFRTRADALALELHRLSTLPEDRGDHTLSVRTGLGAELRWRGSFGLNPVAASGELTLDTLLLDRLWPYLRGRLQMAPPQGEAALQLAYNARYAQGRTELALERVEARLTKLALRGAEAAEPALALDTVVLRGGRLDLGKREAGFEQVEIGPGRLALVRAADGRLDVQDWLRAPAPAPAAAASAAATASAASAPAARAGPTTAASAPAAASPAAAPWQLRLGQVDLRGLGLQFTDRGFATPLDVALDAAQVGLRLNARVGSAAAPTLDVEGLTAQLTGLRLRDAADAPPWLELASAALDGASLSLHERRLLAGTLSLRGARVQVARNRDGRIALAERWRRTAVAPAGGPAPAGAAGAAEAAEAPWRFRLDKLQVQDAGIGLADHGVQPAVALAIRDLQAEAQALNEDLAAAVPVSLQFRIDGGGRPGHPPGGRFEARGRLVPGAPSADLQLALQDLALTPLQPYVAQATTLTLASGRASTRGRLRVDPSRWRYDGRFDVAALRLDEAGERLVGWERLGSDTLTLGPQGLRIGELRIDGLGAKLIIAKDRSVNVAQVMKPATKAPAASAPAPAASVPGGAASAPPAAASPPRYRIAIDRIRVAGGSVDFADLSLALPFGTRIHQLQGQLVGLNNQGPAPAQVELDGRVDEFGLARAAGQIRLFDPTAYTDLTVVFRNVEMANLTPYSATFAGRRIASGKLSLDLQYKLDRRQLAGENRIVMDKLTLGERVESPDASNLPLELAIAILEDADGRIDLGLPVSGSLDDPKFSYGALIGKAILGLLTKLVTAPFRALGALFGGGEQAPEAISFDVGRSELLPPEREKLQRLAGGLAKRPGLALTVQPRFDAQADAQALRELALRRALAQAAGRALAEGEDPGPVSTAEPATRAALEKLFAQRFGAAELQSLQQRHAQANPAPPPAGAGAQVLSRLGSLLKTAPPPLSPEEAERLRGADLPALLLQRLLAAQAVDDAALRRLAEARAAAIRAELAARGVAAERLQLGTAEAQAGSGDGRVVSLPLGLAAGPRAGATPPPAAASLPGAGAAAGAAASAPSR